MEATEAGEEEVLMGGVGRSTPIDWMGYPFVMDSALASVSGVPHRSLRPAA